MQRKRAWLETLQSVEKEGKDAPGIKYNV